MRSIYLIALGLTFLQVNSIQGCGGPGRTWEGNVSTDWGNADNWNTNCGTQVPGPTKIAFISGVIPNQPVVSGAYEIRGVELDQSANLTVGAGGSLSVLQSVGTSGFTEGTVFVKDGGLLSTLFALSSLGSVSYQLSNGATLSGQGQDLGAVAAITSTSTGSGNTVTITAEGTLQQIQLQNVNDSLVFQGNVSVLDGVSLAGRLALNSTLEGAFNLTNGRLSGTGRIIGDVQISGGTISPGNSIGTMTVTGNYTQFSGSTYHVQIDSTGASSLLDISGSANIDTGAILSVESLDGGAASTPYTILTAAGGVTGTYGTVITSGLPRTPNVTYDANNIYLLFQNFLSAAKTHNQKEVAIQLDSLTNPDPAQQSLLNQLNALSNSALAEAMGEMSGSQYVTFLPGYEAASRQFQQRLNNVLRPIYTDPCSCSQTCAENWQPWIEINGVHLRLQGNSNGASAQWNGVSLSGGVQSTLNSHWTVGSALSYEADRIHFDSHQGSGRNHFYLASIYSVLRTAKSYLLADFFAGYGEGKITRKVHINDLNYHAKGKPKGFLTGAYAEAGIDYTLCNILVQPFVGLDAGYFAINRFSEWNANPIGLRIHRGAYVAATSALGGHFTYNPQACGIELGLDLAWRYRLTKVRNSLGVNFETFGNSFTILGDYLGRNSLDTTLSFQKECGHGSLVFIDLTGQWWTHATSYSLSGGFQWTW